MPRSTRVARFASIMLAATLAGCSRIETGPPSLLERRAISDTLRAEVLRAYDFTRPDPVAALMALYPDTGRIVSAASGRLTSTHAELERGIRAFWDNVGRNMRQPQFVIDSAFVDVLSRDAGVMTMAYRIPHLTPKNEPHVLAGVWTALFVRRGGRWVIVQEHLSDAGMPPM
jgi:hypothetical protein